MNEEKRQESVSGRQESEFEIQKGLEIQIAVAPSSFDGLRTSPLSALWRIRREKRRGEEGSYDFGEGRPTAGVVSSTSPLPSFLPARNRSLLSSLLLFSLLLTFFAPSRAFAAGLDTTFNGVGYFSYLNNASGGAWDHGSGIAVDSSGRILVAGQLRNADGNMDMAVWRFKADGALDTTFNGTGYFIHNNAAGGNGHDNGNAIVLDNSGRIIIAGLSMGASTKEDMAVWRLNADGTLDSTFNGTGYFTHDGAAGGPNSQDYANAVKLDEDGNIIVVGYTTFTGGISHMTVWRLSDYGTLDTTFNSSGYYRFDDTYGSEGYGTVIDEYGNITVSGFIKNSSGNYDMAVWRLGSDAVLDATFNSTGYFVHNGAAGGSSGNDIGNAVTLDGLGRILVTGHSQNGAGDYDLPVWCLNSNGTLDATFNGTGYFIHNGAAGGNGYDIGYAVTLDGLGRILVSGGSANATGNQDMAVWRLNEDGTLDTTFNGSGYFTHDNAAGGNSGDVGLAITLDGSGRIVVAGYSDNASGNQDMALWRLVTVTTLASGLSGPYGIAVDANNVYWTERDGGTLKKVGINGGTVTTLASGLGQPNWIAEDAANVYWTDYSSGAVKKVSINGGTVTTLATGPYFYGTAVDASDVYWCRFGSGGSINKVGIDGGSTTALASELNAPHRLAIDATDVYWAESGGTMIKKVGKNGGSVTDLATGLNNPHSVAVDSAYVYWAEYGSGAIKKVGLTGGTVTTLADGLTNPDYLVIDEAFVYWTENGDVIKKISKDGGIVTTLASGLSNPASIAVDSTSVYWTEYYGGMVRKIAKGLSYTITASAGSNGSITPSGSVSVISGGSQTFTITLDTGYHVADVLVDGVSVGAVTSYQFTSVSADHTISASFAIDDVMAPAISSATSSTSNGYYKSGSSINITLNFSEAVSSTGLTINLNSGASITTDALTNVSSWSGTYTVGASETSDDLSISSITGTITDAALNTTTDPTIPAGQNISESKAIVIDTTDPIGSISINSGSLYTNNPSVTLSLTCSDVGSGCWGIQINDGSTFGNPISMYDTYPWNLPAGDGEKTVNVSFKDNAGNWSAPYSVTITLDTTPPAVSAGLDKTKNTQFTHTATATDLNTTTYLWTKQSGPGTVTFGSPTELATTISGDTNGTYTIRFTATDAAGNPSYDDITLTWDTNAILLTDGLVAYWPFNGNANDESGNGHDGILNGASLINDRSGVADSAYSFDGIDDKISVPAFDMGTDWTISGWLNPASCSDNQHCVLFARSNENYDGMFIAYLGGEHEFHNEFAAVLGSGWQVVLQTGTKYDPNNWYHITVTKNNNTYALYVNDVKKSEQEVTDVSSEYQSRDITLGYWYISPGYYLSYTEAYLNGLIDDIRIYNRALTASEIHTLYSGGAIDLPRTGQTKCYDESGTEIGCAGTGQDGEIQAGVTWPNPRFTNSDGTTPINDNIVLDKLTGLEWTKDASTPTFAGAISTCTGGQKDWQAALDYVACLNTNNYLGHNDWRLPNVGELQSLVNAQSTNVGEWLFYEGFTSVQSASYWTSTTWGSSTVYAWSIFMYNGNPLAYVKSVNHEVWPVRGPFGSSVISISKTGQMESYSTGDDGDLQIGVEWPSPRFTDNNDGTVTDNLTGLIWLKNANCTNTVGGIVKGNGYLTWENALAWSNNLANGSCGLTDGSTPGQWRLPNRGELASLTDASRGYPALISGHPFGNVQSAHYWASTTFASFTSFAWGVDMEGGYEFAGDKTFNKYVWPVRGGTISTIPDTIGPAVDSVTSATANGHYKVGGVINITLNFTETVSSTGLTINLNSGASITTGVLSSVSNFSGTYTVETGQTSADLNITSITGTMTDAADNSTTDPTIPAGQNIDDSKDIVIDTTAPVVNAGVNRTRRTSITQTATATDASAMTYQWTKQSGPGTVNFGSPTALSTTISASADGTYVVSFTATDAAGNAASDDMQLTWDTVAPTLSISQPSAPYTKNSDVTYAVTYSGANSVTLAAGDITVNKTGTAEGTALVSGTGTTSRTVTISGISGDGTLGITIALGTAKDAAGNTAAGSGAGETFKADNTAPVASASPSGGPLTSPQNVLLSCDDGAGSGCLTIYYTTDGTDPSAASSVYFSAIEVSATTTLKFFAVDKAGNARDPKSESYIFDTTAPTIAIGSPADKSTKNVVYRISGTATDPAPASGLSKVEVKVYQTVDGVVYYLHQDMFWRTAERWLTAAGTDAWGLDISANWVSGQWYTIEAKATDNAGHASTSMSSFYCYNGVPVFTDLTLSLSSQAVKNDSTVDLSGKLTRLPDIGVDLSGLTVTFTITDPDGIVLSPALSTTVSESGSYTKTGVSGFTKKGVYTIEAAFAGNAYLAASESDIEQLLVGAVAGYAIIVEGKVSNNDGEESHNKTVKRVYDILRERGFIDANINYFNYDTNRTGVDKTPSKSAIQYAITSWAKGKMNASAAPLYIIMVDHGGPKAFYIDAETITPENLNAWLTTLESGLTQDALREKRVIINGSCHSGSFIPALSQAPTSSNGGRVIITSAAADEESYKGPMESDTVRSGEFFIEELFKELGKGSSFRDSFVAAAEQTEAFTLKGGSSNSPNKYNDHSVQHPLLDDDGDGIGSNDLSDGTGDGVASDALFLGTGKTNSVLNPAEFTEVTPTRYLGEATNNALLWGIAADNNEVDHAWVEIRSLADELAGGGGTGQLELDIPRVALSFNPDKGRWQGNYNQFTTPGEYDVFYFTSRKLTQEVSLMKRSRVYKNYTANTPPSAFSLQSPANGSEQKTVLLLSWGNSFDEDGLAYTLLISRNMAPTIYNSVYVWEEIPVSMAAIGLEAGLEDGAGMNDQDGNPTTPYYWKVIAVDRYGATTSSEVRSFKTNNANPELSGFIEGMVTDKTTGAVVKSPVIDVSRGIVRVKGSDYNVYGRPGEVALTVSASGYAETTVTATIKSGETVRLNIGLTDNASPETTITSGPSSPTTSKTAKFYFKSNEAGSTFKCKLDLSTFALCMSPMTYTNLPAGSHIFRVMATDASSHKDSTPATYTWTVK